VSDFSIHLAPNAPWLLLVLVTLGFAALGLWAYRFAVPPLPPRARRALPAVRGLAVVLVLWLLAQPVVGRAAGGGPRVVVLLDRSRSMDLPAAPGGPTRAQVAAEAVERLRRGLAGRAAVEVVPFASALMADSAGGSGRG